MATKQYFNSFLLLLIISVIGVHAEVTFNYLNNCKETLWLSASSPIQEADPVIGPGILSIFYTPDEWSGSIWVRTKCISNASYFLSCETGDCGSGKDSCQGLPPNYPVTQLNFNIKNVLVSYEVSLNHGHNVPVRIKPMGGSLYDGSGACPVVDCIADIANVCAGSLVAVNKAGLYVGCHSACDGLKDPKYCCTGNFTGEACQPNQYSQSLKKVCALAHTYPGDANPPIYQCNDASRYDITFCPE